MLTFGLNVVNGFVIGNNNNRCIRSNTMFGQNNKFHHLRHPSIIYLFTGDETNDYVSDDDDGDDDDDDKDDKDRNMMEDDLHDELHKRSQWQSPQVIVGKAMNKNGDSRRQEVPMPQIITTTKRLATRQELEFRQQERILIQELLQGDEAVAKLRQLWFAERGPAMEAQLYEADSWIGKGGTRDNWTKAEEILFQLIQQDPTFFEPFVRLSKLYTLQGRFADSQQICLSLHQAKPWHYVVLETMVVNTMVLEHNRDLQTWASKRLPPPSLSKERKEWVTRAIQDSMRLEKEQKEALEQMKMEDEKDDNDITDNERLDWQ